VRADHAVRRAARYLCALPRRAGAHRTVLAAYLIWNEHKRALEAIEDVRRLYNPHAVRDRGAGVGARSLGAPPSSL